MSKRNKRSNRFRQQPINLEGISNIRDEEDTSLTFAPNEPRTDVNTYWMSKSTSVPGADKDKDVENSFSQTPAALADKMLTGRLRIAPESAYLVMVILWVIACGWLFISDNQAGRLETIEGIRWVATKALYMTILLVIGLFFLVFHIFISELFRKQQNKNPKPQDK